MACSRVKFMFSTLKLRHKICVTTWWWHTLKSCFGRSLLTCCPWFLLATLPYVMHLYLSYAEFAGLSRYLPLQLSTKLISRLIYYSLAVCLYSTQLYFASLSFSSLLLYLPTVLSCTCSHSIGRSLAVSVLQSPLLGFHLIQSSFALYHTQLYLFAI